MKKLLKMFSWHRVSVGGLEDNKIEINKMGIPKRNEKKKDLETEQLRQEILDNASLCDYRLG